EIELSKMLSAKTKQKRIMRYQLIGPVCQLFLQFVAVGLLVSAQAQTQDQTPAPKTQEYDFSAPAGPHHRRVDTTVTVRDENGNPVEKPTHYVEVATGMNYFEDSQWKTSEEKIE